MLETIISICAIIGTVISVLTWYKIIFYVIGLFKSKKFKPTDIKHRYGICIAARNEERVIKNLLESILNQDYPLDKLCVFVVADNCTDKTVQICEDFSREHADKLKVVVYQHENPNERTKGFALRYLFNQIKTDYTIESFDGYFIFDADNVLLSNYFTKMNEAFENSGEQNKIVTSFRNSKNINHNWISYMYAMHWMRTRLKENRGKSLLKQSCRIQGTGFLIANEILKDGWNYTSLTEDRAFCTDAVVNNYRVSYCDEAIFYDEQPTNLKVAFRQRIRWAKGHLQSFAQYSPKLIKNMFRRGHYFPTTYDCFWLNFPGTVVSAIRKIITWTCKICIAIMVGKVWGTFAGILSGYLLSIGRSALKNYFDELMVLIVFRKRLLKTNFFKSLIGFLLFPLFDIIGRISTYIALFKKVEWKPIPHNSVLDIGEVTSKTKTN